MLYKIPSSLQHKTLSNEELRLFFTREDEATLTLIRAFEKRRGE